MGFCDAGQCSFTQRSGNNRRVPGEVHYSDRLASVFSDLNPIEHVWGSMKDYIQYHYPRLERGRLLSYDELRGIVKEAWNDATKPDKLEKLIRSMPTRCEAVILAQGGPVKY